VLLGLYSESLKEESTGSSSSTTVDLTGPTLPALKLLIERGFSKSNTVAGSHKGTIFADLVDGFMKQILGNIQECFGKLESKKARVVSPKLGNNLLAYVLVLTCLPSEVRISRAGLEEYCLVLCKLISHDVSEVAATALHCSKLLLLNHRRGFPSGIYQVTLQQFLPCYMAFILSQVSRLDSSDQQQQQPQQEDKSERIHGSLVVEIFKIFAALVGMLPAERRQQVLVLVLPLYLRVMEVEGGGKEMGSIGISMVLQLARVDAIQFKQAMSSLDGDERSRLECWLRGSVSSDELSGGGGGVSSMSLHAAVPSIELKRFG